MANYGWQVTGIDYIPRAIRRAKRKARQTGLAGQASFTVGDVLDPNFVSEQFDLILDIGCFHSFSGSDIILYVRNVSSHLKPGATLLLYAHLKENPESSHGVSEEDLTDLGKYLRLIQRRDGQESSRPSAWLHYKKK